MKKILLLGLAHGVNDCMAGFVLGSLLFESMSLSEIGLSILIYNVLAFGGQIPFAHIFQTSHYPKKWLLSGFLLIALGIMSYGFSYKLAVFSLGIASAIIHVVGGYETIQETDKALGLGLFASPGVMGLILGGYLAHIHFEMMVPGLIICGLLTIMTMRQRFSIGPYNSPVNSNPQFDRHDVWMIVILTVIAFRSVIWNIFQLVNEGDYETLMIIGISAMMGKIMGGYMSDIWGHRRYTLIALMIAMPLLTLLKNHLWALVAGIFFLQSTVPSSAKILLGYFEKTPAKGISFVFGLPIILGGLLFYSPFQGILQSQPAMIALFIFSMILLYKENRKMKAVIKV